MSDAKSHLENINDTGEAGLQNGKKASDVEAEDSVNLVAQQRWAEFVELLLSYTSYYVNEILDDRSVTSPFFSMYYVDQSHTNDQDIRIVDLFLKFDATMKPVNGEKIPVYLAVDFQKFRLVDFLNYLRKTNDRLLLPSIKPDECPFFRIVSVLLDAGADPRACNAEKLTVLHLAVLSENTALIQLLLDRGCSPNAKDNDDSSPLSLAIEQGKLKVVQLLIEGGTLVDDSHKIVNCLKLAVYYGNEEMVRLFVEYGAAVKATLSYDDDEDLLLFALAYICRRKRRECRLGIVSLLLDAGIEKQASTALHVAVADADVDLVRLLLERARRRGDAIKFNIPPQEVVFQLPKFSNILHILKERDIPFYKYFPCKDMLSYAIFNNDEALLQVLLEVGYPPDASNPLDVKPLLDLAVKEGGQPEILKLLLQYVEAESCLDWLKLAIDRSKETLVRFLLKKMVTIPRSMLNYAILESSQMGNVDIVRMVITEGADINCKSSNKKTCLMIATRSERFDVMMYLIEHGAKLNEQDDEGNTALHILLSMKRAGIILCGIQNFIGAFLEAGADLNIVNEKGHTPFWYVRSNNFTPSEKQVFLKSIALLLSLDKYVNPVNLSYIKDNRSWSERLKVYQQELLKMKEMKVLEEYSYLQVISDVDYHQLIPLFRKENDVFIFIRVERKFPFEYNDLFWKHFIRKYDKYKRRIFVKRATYFLSVIFQSKLPPEVVTKIAEHLPDKALKKLIK